MEPMNLLVARRTVADDMRRQVNPLPDGAAQQRRTRITRQVVNLFRRSVTRHSRSAGKPAAAPRVVSESFGD
ncbi:hypothetical protein F1D05_01110 [Kribbella qitaiheensis]|uniref:Uncharacterized protein n=1 Tax=Kribbella qitaiheensis TaxID=1544730 RepID=A0A7G6WRY5_9ACTN|nr:hypothetical protein [Kribbella qitaiheensis]QNE16750.1 hypothetical protein F1D05_01110 [Kribbella qitaiheensis]